MNLKPSDWIALLVPFGVIAAGWVFRSRVRLRYGSPYGFTYLVPQPLYDPKGQLLLKNQSAGTQAYWIMNEGRATAQNVEVTFNWEPTCLNVWPVREYEVGKDSNGRYVLKFKTLAHNEAIGCELLTVNAQLPGLIHVRSDSGPGKEVTLKAQRWYGRWFRWTVLALLVLGVFAGAQIAVRLGVWLYAQM